MRALIFAAVLIAAASPCLAETYCAASRTASVGADGIGNNLKSLREQCQPGETVVLEGNSLSMIAMTCDFSKAVVTAGQNIICVLSSPSGMKAQAAASPAAR